MAGPNTVSVTTFSAILGQVIAQHRTVQNISQAGLARRLGVAQSVMSRVESGALPITTDMLCRIGDAVGVPSSELLRGAEAGARLLGRRGVRVLYEPQREVRRSPDAAGMLLGAAAVAAIIALAVAASDGET